MDTQNQIIFNGYASSTIEDDFGFVSKDFVKPTAEGRQFIKWEFSPPANDIQVNPVWRSY